MFLHFCKAGVLTITKPQNVRLTPLDNNVASKMAGESVCHSTLICVALILFLNCSQIDKPYGELINHHKKSPTNLTKNLFEIPYQ